MATISVIVASVAALVLAILLFVIGRASVRFQAVRASAVAGTSPDYWPVLLRDYYVNALPQATTGFWFGLSLAIGSAGLAVWLLLTHNAGQWSLLADTIVGVVAIFLLIVSNSSRRLMVAMIEALRDDRKFSECIRLAGQTEGDARQRLLAILALHFAGLTPGSVDGTIVRETLWPATPVKLPLNGSCSRRGKRGKRGKSGKSFRLCRVC